MRVPLTGEAARRRGGEAAWLQPQGRKPYWRGSVASLAHEFAG